MSPSPSPTKSWKQHALDSNNIASNVNHQAWLSNTIYEPLVCQVYQLMDEFKLVSWSPTAHCLEAFAYLAVYDEDGSGRMVPVDPSNLKDYFTLYNVPKLYCVCTANPARGINMPVPMNLVHPTQGSLENQWAFGCSSSQNGITCKMWKSSRASLMVGCPSLSLCSCPKKDDWVVLRNIIFKILSQKVCVVHKWFTCWSAPVKSAFGPGVWVVASVIKVVYRGSNSRTPGWEAGLWYLSSNLLAVYNLCFTFSTFTEHLWFPVQRSSSKKILARQSMILSWTPPVSLMLQPSRRILRELLQGLFGQSLLGYVDLT
ncbi:hypothetical protein C8J56DRAFT_895032 [Mycena floridula]|nr:hypothetical protein C8J56DRAFT_895032 [Mycena floridula]